MANTLAPRLYLETVGGVTVATFADADLVSERDIESIGEQLDAIVDNLGPTRVVLNFREVRYMSSTMLAILLKFLRRIQRAEGKLRLCSIAPSIKEVFRITRFDRLFEIDDQESTALDALSS